MDATVKREHVYGPDHIATEGVTIYVKNGSQLTECMRISPSYRSKGVFDAVAKDMAAAVILLLDRGMNSHDLASLLGSKDVA